MRNAIEEIIVGILMFPVFLFFGIFKGLIDFYSLLHKCYEEEEEQI